MGCAFLLLAVAGLHVWYQRRWELIDLSWKWKHVRTKEDTVYVSAGVKKSCDVASFHWTCLVVIDINCYTAAFMSCHRHLDAISDTTCLRSISTSSLLLANLLQRTSNV
jgi:hypothetical protein